MDYKLAKELKDAGYKQPQLTEVTRGGEYYKKTYIPTLSELIDACGDRFDKLIKTEVQWIVHATYPPQLMVVNGETPEEAVAKLYIKLNEK